VNLPPHSLRIAEALSGTAISWDGTKLRFVAPNAFPPGQPLELTLWPDSAEALSISARSLGSKRREDQQFDVQVRLVSLSRNAREILARAFPTDK
jgi:hypothetical protein